MEKRYDSIYIRFLILMVKILGNIKSVLSEYILFKSQKRKTYILNFGVRLPLLWIRF